MSYEVYIDVRHHPRHLEDFERHLSTCAKLSEPRGSDPSEYERVRAVVGMLRAWADQLDPDVMCGHCREPRHRHLNWTSLPRCFGRYGPVTQYDWWETSDAS